jgi:outer membrane lipoprotein-sorting protein
MKHPKNQLSSLRRLCFCILTFFIIHNSSFSLRAQSTVQFYLANFTTATNDTTITVKSLNNPVIYNGVFYWQPPNGTNVNTTNGFAQVTLIPGQYNVSLAGVPQSWTITVTNSAASLNAAGLTTSTLIYNGINSISGNVVSSDGHGNYLVNADTNGATAALQAIVVTNDQPSVTLGNPATTSVSLNLVGTNPAGGTYANSIISTTGGISSAFWTGTFKGNGGALTGLNPANFASGCTSPGNNWVGTFTGNAAGATNYFSTNLINDTTVLSILSTNAPPEPAGNWAQYIMDPYATNFQLCGTIPPLSLGGAYGVYLYPSRIQSGAGGPGFETTYGASLSFGLDGSQLIVNVSGNGYTWGLAVNGVMTGYTVTMPNDGNGYWYTITFATAARRNITLFNAWPLYSIYAPVTNGFFPNRQAQTHRVAFLGDSYTEQDYAGPAPCYGPICQLQNLRPDLNLIPLGEGGTGFYNAGSAGGTNFAGRIADVVNVNPESVVIWGGINDQIYATNLLLTNPVYTGATNVLLQLRARLPNASVLLIGPQWPASPSPVGSSTVFNVSLLLSNACALAGITYVDPLLQPWITGNVNTPNSGNADNYIQSSDATHPIVPQGAIYFANQLNGVLASNLSSVLPNDQRQMVLANAANQFAGTFTGSFNGPTNTTVPVNTSTIRAWVNYTNSTGGTFKLPLYQ